MRKKVFLILLTALLVCMFFAKNKAYAWWIYNEFSTADTANDLVKGSLYKKYIGYELTYEDKYNGSRQGKFVENGKTDLKDFVSYEHIAWTDYQKLPTKAYCMYYLGIANMSYQNSQVFTFNEKDVAQGKTITVKLSECKAESYEDSITTTQEFQISGKAGGSFSGIKAEVSASYKNSISKKYTEKHSIENRDEYQSTYTITEPGYYYAQRRALYSMYVVLEFEIEYYHNVRTEKVWLWNDRIHSYTEKGYRYVGYGYIYSFFFDCGFSFNRYLIDEENIPYLVRYDGLLNKDDYLLF